MIKRYFAIAALCSIIVQSAYADLVVLGTNTFVASPFEITAGATTGPALITFANPTSSLSDPAADRMAGWMLDLFIAADAGSTGSVTFASAAAVSGGPFNPPATVGIVVSITNAGHDLLAFDHTSPFAGVVIPNSSASIVSLTLTASADASGRFGIYARGGADGSHWTGADPINLNPERAFANVAFGNTARIGEIQAVPEPSAALLIGLTGLFGASICWISKKSITL